MVKLLPFLLLEPRCAVLHVGLEPDAAALPLRARARALAARAQVGGVRQVELGVLWRRL